MSNVLDKARVESSQRLPCNTYLVNKLDGYDEATIMALIVLIFLVDVV